MNHIYEDDIWFNDLEEKTIDVNPHLIIEANNTDSYYKNNDGQDFFGNVQKSDEFTNVNGVEQIFVEDIIKKDPNDLKAVHIMRYQSSIAQFIRGLEDGNQPNKMRTIKKCD